MNKKKNFNQEGGQFAVFDKFQFFITWSHMY